METSISRISLGGLVRGIRPHHLTFVAVGFGVGAVVAAMQSDLCRSAYPSEGGIQMFLLGVFAAQGLAVVLAVLRWVVGMPRALADLGVAFAVTAAAPVVVFIAAVVVNVELCLHG